MLKIQEYYNSSYHSGPDSASRINETLENTTFLVSILFSILSTKYQFYSSWNFCIIDCLSLTVLFWSFIYMKMSQNLSLFKYFQPKAAKKCCIAYDNIDVVIWESVHSDVKICSAESRKLLELVYWFGHPKNEPKNQAALYQKVSFFIKHIINSFLLCEIFWKLDILNAYLLSQI